MLAGYSLVSIVNDLNARGASGLPAVRPGCPSTLAAVLINPRIAGLRAYKGEIVGAAVWPAIISREQHEKLVAPARTRPAGGCREDDAPTPAVRHGRGARCGEQAEKTGEQANRMVNRPEKGRTTTSVGGRRSAAAAARWCPRQLDALVVERVFTALDSPEFTEASRPATRGRRGGAGSSRRTRTS